MAMLFSSSGPGSGWILYLKVLLALATVLFMAVLTKTSAPAITDFVVSDVPSIYGFMLSWLRPPYLYILINCIIISIVLSSKLQCKVKEAPLTSPTSPIPAEPVKVFSDVPGENAIHDGAPAWSGNFYAFGGSEDGALDGGEKKVINDDEVGEVLTPAMLPERNDSTDFSFLNLEDKKPPVSARFPPRKSVKSNAEAGKALGVTKPKRNDTLEGTWKAITEGRSMPLARHLRKSDTWNNRLRRNDENTPPAPRMKKSETFNDRSGAAADSGSTPSSMSLAPPGSRKLRREPSLSQEELNRRVEAFIKKFNEEMRLQRQESLNRYQEMIRRGAV